MTHRNRPKLQRIEPARLEEIPEAVTDVVAELSASAAKLSHALHPQQRFTSAITAARMKADSMEIRPRLCCAESGARKAKCLQEHWTFTKLIMI